MKVPTGEKEYHQPMPPAYHLSREQRNDLFRAIESSGEPIDGFALVSYFETSERHPMTRIIHAPTQAVILIGTIKGGYFEVYASLGAGLTEAQLFTRPKQLEWQSSDLRWSEALGIFAEWAQAIGRWTKAAERYMLETPDLWGEFLSE
jgi:hypothetical protein